MASDPVATEIASSLVTLGYLNATDLSPPAIEGPTITGITGTRVPPRETSPV